MPDLENKTEEVIDNSTAETLASISDTVKDLAADTVSQEQFSKAQDSVKTLIEAAEKKQKAAQDELTELKDGFKRTEAVRLGAPDGVIKVVDPYEGPIGMMRFFNDTMLKTKKGSTGYPETLQQYITKRDEQERDQYELLAKECPLLFASGAMNESVDVDGGVLIPKEHINEILRPATEESQIVSKVRKLPMSGNRVVIPSLDVTTLVDGGITGGTTAAWKGEAATLTPTRSEFGEIELKINSLKVLTRVTNELIQDSPVTIAPLVQSLMSDAVTWKLENSILNGTGSGQPQGILSAPSTRRVVVAAEGSQLADTIEAENVIKMYSRMYAPNLGNAIWIVNQDTITQLFTMNIAIGTAGSLIYMPAGGLSGLPFGTLFGLPVIMSQHAQTLGDEGDIYFVDLSQYLYVSKGMNFAESMHLYFDSDEMAFRLTMRADGQPGWKNTLTPASGSANTLSPFVTLAERA